MKENKKSHGLLLGILIFILVAVVLSWLVPNSAYSSTGLSTTGALTRIGLNDWAWVLYYAIYFALDKILILLAVGGLYGVLSRTNAYEKIVTKIAKFFKNKKVAVVLFSTLIAVLTSLFTQTFVVIIFIPFIISILNRMKLDKLTILATTFGSMIVGVLGATYGTDGLVYFNQYFNYEVGPLLLVRAGILVVGLVLFNFFTIWHMNKVKKNAPSTDMFEMTLDEDDDGKKKSNIYPIVIIGILLFVLCVLAFIDWNTNFGIEIFDNFHEAVIDVSINDEFNVFESILGTHMGALGSWDLFGISSVVFLFTIILGICYRFKFNEFVDSLFSGLKKMMLPIGCLVGAFVLMVIVYMSPYVTTIIDKVLSFTDGFNIATMTLSSLIANIFHTDLGFTGYIMASYLAVEYVDYINPVYIMFTSLYGLVQFFIPTSALLGVGLTALNVQYKDWLKHIWRFVLGMFVCLLILFIVLAII